MGAGDRFTHAPHFEFANVEHEFVFFNRPVSMTASSVSRRTWSQRSALGIGVDATEGPPPCLTPAGEGFVLALAGNRPPFAPGGPVLRDLALGWRVGHRYAIWRVV
jgi:hypothetical protein